MSAAIAQALLEQAGFEVVAVGDGLAAWERLAPNPFFFDAVVTDNQMPELTGLQLVQKLRAIRYPGKIIVQTSALTERERALFVALGVDAVLIKPQGIGQLVAMLT